jgi:hypothetical protein
MGSVRLEAMSRRSVLVAGLIISSRIFEEQIAKPTGGVGFCTFIDRIVNVNEVPRPVATGRGGTHQARSAPFARVNYTNSHRHSWVVARAERGTFRLEMNYAKQH